MYENKLRSYFGIIEYDCFAKFGILPGNPLIEAEDIILWDDALFNALICFDENFGKSPEFLAVHEKLSFFIILPLSKLLFII